jgi:MOSC domain-containing protein YiiM
MKTKSSRFDRLVAQYYPAVYSFAARFTDDPREAVALTRDAFSSARKQTQNLRNPTAIAIVLISAVIRAGLASAWSDVADLERLRRGWWPTIFGFYHDLRTMNLLSINVGLPREIEWKGKIVRTSIFKSPVQGRVRVARLNLEGDQQSDLSVHGGIDKAVYAYPSEHYPFWHQEFHGVDLPWGAFGENFTTAGLLEETVHIGDRFRGGSAEFVVTQPRMPCFKLGIRFNRPDIVKRFLQSGRTGFYFAVLKEGEVTAGDSIELIERDEHGVKVADIVNLYGRDARNQDLLHLASELPSLPKSWRDYFRTRLWNPDD